MRMSGLPMIPMVKADAYGVGVAGVLGALEPLSPLAYGVATVKEGETLRALGISRQVIVFTPLLLEEFPAARAARITPTLGCEEAIRTWGSTDYHLAIDTGMSRAGVQWRDVSKLVNVIREFPPDGAFTHFHSAELDDGTVEHEEKLFRDAIALLPRRPRILHTDNSAAIVRPRGGNSTSGGGGVQWNAIRPGVFLYGVGSGESAGVQPEPVVHVRARVVELRTIEPGDPVSYDATYVASTRRRVATAAAGYGDGYPRALSGKARGIIRGNFVDLLGRVTMDMTMFDVTDVPCEVGDVVTLIGRDAGGGGEKLITVEDIGVLAGMSPYEVLTGLSVRLDRVYHQ